MVATQSTNPPSHRRRRSAVRIVANSAAFAWLAGVVVLTASGVIPWR